MMRLQQFELTKSDRVDIKDLLLTLWPVMFIQAYLCLSCDGFSRVNLKKILPSRSAVIQIDGIPKP